MAPAAPRAKPKTANPRRGINTNQIRRKLNLLSAHVPCIDLGRVTGRPATARYSVCDSEADPSSKLFPESCSRYVRIQNTVNIKKQEPRKDVVKTGITLEYSPNYDAVLPQSRSGITRDT